MDNQQSILIQAVHQRNVLSAYRDRKYEALINQLNTQAGQIIKEDLGSQFVRNCGRDLAGEVVRNFFDTSDYYITVDQLATRILKFTYEDEYDPLKDNGSSSSIRQTVYNYNDISSSTLDSITEDLDAHQEQLFTQDRATDSLDMKGKKAYREQQRDESGDLFDELSGKKETKRTIIRNGKEVPVSDLQADHVQAREAARYNAKYVTDKGVEQLRVFWNSADNMQMMHASANTSKGDVRVCQVNGKIEYKNTKDKTYDPSTDITHKATPEQLAQATITQWEKGDIDSPKVQKLIEQGYLVRNEDGSVHVPKSVRTKLESNIRHSQNVESQTILKNTRYGAVGKDALNQTKASMGRILSGQIIYYAAPPLVFEVKCILRDKHITLDDALQRIKDAGRRIGNYIVSKLGDIFKNVVFNSLKKFIKTFMDILINLVKATVKKMLRLAKNLLMAVVDSAKIIATPGTSPAQKADSVFTLFGITITNFVIEILFELLEDGLHIPEFLLMPLQILASVVCSNLVMLVLQKADLFDVRFGFKRKAVQDLFANERAAYEQEMMIATSFVDDSVEQMILQAQSDCRNIYKQLQTIRVEEESVRESLQVLDRMFGMNIDFDDEWKKFVGQYDIPVVV